MTPKNAPATGPTVVGAEPMRDVVMNSSSTRRLPGVQAVTSGGYLKALALVRVAGGPQAPGLAGLDSGVSIK